MNKPPTWYYVVAVIATVWAMLGCYAYLSQVTMGPAEMAALPQAQQDIWAMMPAWVKGAYAVAVWSGLVGGLSLLARSRFARPAYLLSLVAVVVQFGWTFLATPILSTVGTSAIALPLCVTVAAVLLVWFTNHAIARNWLR